MPHKPQPSTLKQIVALVGCLLLLAALIGLAAWQSPPHVRGLAKSNRLILDPKP